MEQHRGLVLEPRLWGRAGQLGEAKAQKDVAHSSTSDKEGTVAGAHREGGYVGSDGAGRS